MCRRLTGRGCVVHTDSAQREAIVGGAGVDGSMAGLLPTYTLPVCDGKATPANMCVNACAIDDTLYVLWYHLSMMVYAMYGRHRVGSVRYSSLLFVTVRYCSLQFVTVRYCSLLFVTAKIHYTANSCNRVIKVHNYTQSTCTRNYTCV